MEQADAKRLRGQPPGCGFSAAPSPPRFGCGHVGRDPAPGFRPRWWKQQFRAAAAAIVAASPGAEPAQCLQQAWAAQAIVRACGADGNTEGENDATKRDLQFHGTAGWPRRHVAGHPDRQAQADRGACAAAGAAARTRPPGPAALVIARQWQSPLRQAASSRQGPFHERIQGRGPQQDDSLKDAVPGRRSSANRPPPPDRGEMRTLRPTRANSRPRAVVDVRTLRDVFLTTHAACPQAAGKGRRARGGARARPGITGGDRVVNRTNAMRRVGQRVPASWAGGGLSAGIGGEWRDARKTYSEPLSGRTPPCPQRAPAVGPPAAGVMPPSAPFGSRERESAAAAQARLQRREAKLDWARAAAANPRSLPPEAPLTIEDLERTSAVPRATPAGKGPREAGGGSAGAGVLEPVVKSIDPREGDNLVASLKLGETVVHVSHGLCRFRGIEHNAWGRGAARRAPTYCSVRGWQPVRARRQGRCGC